MSIARKVTLNNSYPKRRFLASADRAAHLDQSEWVVPTRDDTATRAHSFYLWGTRSGILLLPPTALLLIPHTMCQVKCYGLQGANQVSLQTGCPGRHAPAVTPCQRAFYIMSRVTRHSNLIRFPNARSC